MTVEDRAPAQASAAAFFDALIAQQDRHRGNQRVDGARLGLIDHGFAFALSGAYLGVSCFVQWRWEAARQPLASFERAALDRLLGSRDLLGLAPTLGRDRADALTDRARRMAATGVVLPPGNF